LKRSKRIRRIRRRTAPQRRRLRASAEPAAVKLTYDEAYNQGYNKGFDDGFARAFEEGYQHAYAS
jgi:hypothetical protein